MSFIHYLHRSLLSGIAFFSLAIISYSHDFHECSIENEKMPSFYSYEAFCDDYGRLLILNRYFKSSNTFATQTTYNAGKIESYKSWSLEGVLTIDYEFLHEQEGSIIRRVYKKRGKERQLADQLQYAPDEKDPQVELYQIRRWFFDALTSKIKQIDHFIYVKNTRLVAIRELFDQFFQDYQQFRFSYDEDNLNSDKPRSYTLVDEQGNILAHYDPSDFSLQNFLKRQSSQNRPYRIAILDSDFDVRHPHLSSKMFISPTETLNGKDSDLNGWIDDLMGWNHDTNSNILLSPVSLPTQGTPASHGTHVASIALDDHNDFFLIGYSGDITDPVHLGKIKNDILRKDIVFTNMSFAIPQVMIMAFDYTSSMIALRELILQTQNTLHVIAAGNDGMDIDSYSSAVYPASFHYDNMLVVAAIDVDELDEFALESYELADFSNYGVDSVDIASPGRDVLAAAQGGGLIRFSGTSMASPYALNHGAMRAYSINSGLSPLEIKELIMKTAYIRNLDHPLPVRSGGILYPSRIAAVAKLLLNNPRLTVEQAVLYKLTEEGHTQDYLQRLLTFWKEQKI